MPLPTADLAQNVIYARGKARDDYNMAGYVVNDDDVALATKALEWARAKFGAIPAEARTPFEHNMYVATKGETVTRSTVGIVAYAVAGYLKEQDQLFRAALAAKNGAESRHLGVVGEKIILRGVTTLSSSWRDTDYGRQYTYKFSTTDGCMVTWFASSPILVVDETVPDRDACWTPFNQKARHPQQGDVFNIAGKVKNHTVWNKALETIVSHCKVLTDAEVAEVEAKEAKKAAAAAKKAAKAAKAVADA